MKAAEAPTSLGGGEQTGGRGWWAGEGCRQSLWKEGSEGALNPGGHQA